MIRVAGEPGLTDAALAALGKRLDVTLPTGLRTLLSRFNGGVPQGAYEVTLGDGTQTPLARLYPAEEIRKFVEFSGEKGKLPFGEDSGGNQFVIDSRGTILFWNHDDDSYTPLADSMERFLEDLKDESESTPLVELLTAKDYEHVKELVSQNPQVRDENCGSALQCAALVGALEIVSWLLDRGEDPTPALHSAVNGDSVDVVRLLLARGADPNWADEFGETPLSRAALFSKKDFIGPLVAAGADPEKEVAGNSPMKTARQFPEIEAAIRDALRARGKPS